MGLNAIRIITLALLAGCGAANAAPGQDPSELTEETEEYIKTYLPNIPKR